MPLNDEPALLHRPLGFAIRINTAVDFDVGDARHRLPGLLTFARTFIAEVLEKEFNTPIAGYPTPARERAARLSVRLKSDATGTEAAQRFVMSVIDICDLEIARKRDFGRRRRTRRGGSR